ncbi:hypothetical protein A2368_02570 [Candidatus Collierbacteria bacterium RIFOXYB1_FULL_49_13]|uniref:Hydrolase TatD n=1 Tax=Candidatus Collierbacteria bacterium RIFOXYB1_FULL_49_13 TaxID=1817728 RepID=A0A1F5FFS2_9BACT|nr:MAG: hypothetical protein A2368_02570 [Candidatus Collierbacteria bacterium RIFOXYB1_FULL_49_13]
MIVDTHCHLTDGKFGTEVTEVVERAKTNGVEKIIVPASRPRDWERIVELTQKHVGVYGMLGVHPEEVDKISDLRFLISELRGKLRQEKIVGIGEIGMDGYWNRKNLVKQVEVFGAQMQLAVDLEVPVAIHSRNSGTEIRQVMESMEKLPRGQFHCFGESEEFLEYVLGKGFYVSFCGNVTYKSADSLRELVKKVPLKSLLLETDSPYLSPEGKRGTRNEPENVRIIGEFIANLLGIQSEELFEITSRNARELYLMIC